MRSIYYEIFEDLRDRIEEGEFPYQSYIPSESALVEEYECSHNTLRKALNVLRLHGYIQPIHGKGVLVIWQPDVHARFVLGDIESFREACERNGIRAHTSVRSFTQITADRQIAEMRALPSATACTGWSGCVTSMVPRSSTTSTTSSPRLFPS